MNDPSTGQRVVLSDRDVQLIQRLRRGQTVDQTVDPYAVSVM